MEEQKKNKETTLQRPGSPPRRKNYGKKKKGPAMEDLG